MPTRLVETGITNLAESVTNAAVEPRGRHAPTTARLLDVTKVIGARFRQ
jgi:hypothetical protein